MRKFVVLASCLGLSACLLLLPAAAQEHFKDQEALALLKSMFPAASGGPHLRAIDAEGSPPPCITARLMEFNSFVRSNPVSPEGRLQLKSLIDQILGPGIKPVLPRTIESAHFTVKYTDSDVEASHNININAAQIQPFLSELDDRYEKFVRTFRKLDPAPPAKLLIDVWNFQLQPGLEDKLAWSDPISTTINIAPSVLAGDPCIVLATLTHELFHRVQQGHANLNFLNQDYWVEGMAEWAPLFANPRDNSFLDYTRDLFANPETSLFDRGYDAVLFWVYLDERYQEVHGKKASGKVMDILLNRVEKKGGSAALMEQVLQPMMAALYRADQLQAGAARVRGAPADALLMQEWHVTNFLLHRYTKKLSYNGYDLHPDDCGNERDFPALTARGGANITTDTSTFSDTTQSRYGAVNYYIFPIEPAVSRMNVKVSNEPLDEVIVTSVGAKGNRIKFVRTTGNKLVHNHPLDFKPGAVDGLLVVVGGADNEGSNTYTFTVNEAAGGAVEIDVKVVATLSTDPNDEFADPIPIEVRVGTETVNTGGEETSRTVVPPGPVFVSVDEDKLTDEFGNQYRVGFVSVTPTRTGQVRRCAPTARGGIVTFTASAADINPDSESDYEVGVRIVPLEAPPVENVEVCS